jgi:hypothetical protein
MVVISAVKSLDAGSILCQLSATAMIVISAVKTAAGPIDTAEFVVVVVSEHPIRTPLYAPE